MTIIDLLNKIANGEADEEKRYKFSPFDYCSVKEFFNRYIIDEENLNLKIIEENKKIEKIPMKTEEGNLILYPNNDLEIITKINEIIEAINSEFNK